MERHQTIVTKLERLSLHDSDRLLWGAKKHNYCLKPKPSPQEIRRIEEEFKFELPEVYKEFVLRCGNGGAGPGEGLWSLDRSIAKHRNHPTVHPKTEVPLVVPDLGKPFPMKFDLAASMLNFHECYPLPDSHEDRMRLPKFSMRAPQNGLLQISDDGAVYTFLVVTGELSGYIWIISPSGWSLPYGDENGCRNLLDWYEDWLDWALNSNAVEWHRNRST